MQGDIQPTRGEIEPPMWLFTLDTFVVTEYEIASGMPTAQDCEKHCIGMLRTIDDLDQHLDEPVVAKFVDLIPGTSLIDDEAQGLLNALRDEKIPRFVQSSEN